MMEIVDSASQWSEATKFLADLADRGLDGLDESASLKPTNIVRDGSNRIIAVRAVVDDGQERDFSADGIHGTKLSAEVVESTGLSMGPVTSSGGLIVAYVSTGTVVGSVTIAQSAATDWKLPSPTELHAVALTA